MLLFLAGWFALVAAWAFHTVACDQPYLTGCGHQNLVTLQFGVAIGGLVPAGLMLFFAFEGQYQRAMVSLGSALVVYSAWALLNDAAVHGWNGLVFL
jgi:hypothetical protein